MARMCKKITVGRRRLFFLGILALALSVLFLPPQVRIMQMQGELRRLRGNEQTLVKKRAEMQKLYRYYSSDAYIEEAARQELGLVKPGEMPILPAVPGEVQPPPKNTEKQLYD